MSSYVKRAMHEDEKIVYAAQLHWIIYQSGFLYVLLGGAVGHFGVMLLRSLNIPKIATYIEPIVSYISVGIVAVGGMLLFGAFVRQMSTELVITNQRIIAKHGLVATTSYELMMTKVEGATIDQSIWGRMWDYGTLMVKGTGGGISPIDHVAKPFKFHNNLMSAIQETEQNDDAPSHRVSDDG